MNKLGTTTITSPLQAYFQTQSTNSHNKNLNATDAEVASPKQSNSMRTNKKPTQVFRRTLAAFGSVLGAVPGAALVFHGAAETNPPQVEGSSSSYTINMNETIGGAALTVGGMGAGAAAGHILGKWIDEAYDRAANYRKP